jgi:hypothetical protein
MIGTVGAEPWDTEWAAARSAEALRYLGRNYPECLENLRALDEYEEQAHRAAMRSDRDGYLEALRDYCRAGRDEALRIRRGRHEWRSRLAMQVASYDPSRWRRATGRN